MNAATIIQLILHSSLYELPSDDISPNSKPNGTKPNQPEQNQSLRRNCLGLSYEQMLSFNKYRLFVILSIKAKGFSASARWFGWCGYSLTHIFCKCKQIHFHTLHCCSRRRRYNGHHIEEMEWKRVNEKGFSEANTFQTSNFSSVNWQIDEYATKLCSGGES